jgi:hypothetical protein
MGTPTQNYVDPSIAGDSGSGTVGDPYGDLQYALNQITRDATNGDQINIKAGTAESLGSALSLASYGTPTADAPLVMRGYTSAANDGGIGAIDCNTYQMFSSDPNYVHLMEIDVYDGPGADSMVNLGNYCSIHSCEVYNSYIGIETGTHGHVFSNHVHDHTNYGIDLQDTTAIAIANFVYDAKFGIRAGTAIFNIVSLSTATSGAQGITIADLNAMVMNNSIYADASPPSASGIQGTTADGASVLNNIVEGWDGASSKGFDLQNDLALYGGNAAYNNGTDYSVTGDAFLNLGSNATLGSSPFTDATNDDFTLVTNLYAIPQSFMGASCYTGLEKGAVQEGTGVGGTGTGTTLLVSRPRIVRPVEVIHRPPARRQFVNQTITDSTVRVYPRRFRREVIQEHRRVRRVLVRNETVTQEIHVQKALFRR